jgi:hypothetical protein
MPGRCPECGLALDDKTVVFVRSRIRRWTLERLGMSVFLFWVLTPIWSMALLAVLGVFFLILHSPGGPWILGFLAVASASLYFFRNKQPRFIAITQEGLVVRNKGDQQTIARNDISIFAIDDVPPTIKLKGSDLLISLDGVFSSNIERERFKRLFQSDRTFGLELEGSTMPDSPEALGDGFLTKAPTPARWLARLGLMLIITATLGMIAAPFFAPLPSLALWSVPAIVLFWAGVITGMIGLWKSDKRKKRP